MKSYLALIVVHLKLAMRERTVIFFNFIFPLIFFFGFGQFLGGRAPGAITRLVSMVLVIGVLGNGLFGAGVRAVAEREMNILRRFKVTPITPVPILVASLVTGWVLYVPVALGILALAHFLYGMEVPERWFSLLVLLSLGCLAFRAIGLIIAAVANSMAESNILVQILYLPMLFISGATVPLSAMPLYVQITAQFLPSAYLNTGIQNILLRAESVLASPVPSLAMVISTVLGTWISAKVFRWEKDEAIPGRAKLYVALVFLPFVAMGAWESYSREHINQTKLLERQVRRSFSRLIRGVRIFTGDGRVIESGSVLIRNGRIERVWDRFEEDAARWKAEAIEARGKTLLPGLIDAHVHLTAPGGYPEKTTTARTFDIQKIIERHLSGYLYSGVTGVRSAGDFTSELHRLREHIQSGEFTGPELFYCGPMFTAEGGHGTEYFRKAPEWLRSFSEQEFVRVPKTAEQARAQVRELKAGGVDGIKAVLEAGAGGLVYQRMDASILAAVAAEARASKLPLVVHTGDRQDFADALKAGPSGIEHGSYRGLIPDDLFQQAARQGVAYCPTLSAAEAFEHLRQGRTDLLSRSLVEQVAPTSLLRGTRARLAGPAAEGQSWRELPVDLETGKENLRRAWRAGMMLVAGTDSGVPLLVHGPALHRELQLWVEAGIPPAVALQAATYNAARLLGVAGSAGLIREGFAANLLLVDGNPLQDITATERISMVFLQGERLDRPSLFEQK